MKRKSDHPKIMLVRSQKGFEPASEYDFERIQRYANGAVVEAQFWQRRSLPRHRLYWVILGIVAENNEIWQTAEIIHNNVKDALGYREKFTGFDGTERYRTESTAFDQMDEADYKIYFDLAMELIRLHFRFDIQKLIQEGQQRLATRKSYHGEDNGSARAGS